MNKLKPHEVGNDDHLINDPALTHDLEAKPLQNLESIPQKPEEKTETETELSSETNSEKNTEETSTSTGET